MLISKRCTFSPSVPFFSLLVGSNHQKCDLTNLIGFEMTVDYHLMNFSACRRKIAIWSKSSRARRMFKCDLIGDDAGSQCLSCMVNENSLSRENNRAQSLIYSECQSIEHKWKGPLKTNRNRFTRAYRVNFCEFFEGKSVLSPNHPSPTSCKSGFFSSGLSNWNWTCCCCVDERRKCFEMTDSFAMALQGKDKWCTNRFISAYVNGRQRRRWETSSERTTSKRKREKVKSVLAAWDGMTWDRIMIVQLVFFYVKRLPMIMGRLFRFLLRFCQWRRSWESINFEQVSLQSTMTSRLCLRRISFVRQVNIVFSVCHIDDWTGLSK